jgi:F0F1-type ATP synthase assembly protein I
MTLAAVVGLFAYIGHLLDEWTGLGPLFLLVGVALGGVGGFLHLIAVIDPTLLPFKSRSSREREAPPPEGEGDGRGDD